MSRYFTPSVIAEKTRLTFNARRENDALIQELLIAATYHCHRGNDGPINAVLKAAVDSGSTRVKGVTLWAELYAPVRVKDEKFVLTKAWKESNITSEDDFAREFEPMLREAPKWYEVAKAEKPKSVWELDKYLDTVVDTLKKHGQHVAAKEILSAKANIAKAAVAASVK